MLKFLVVAVFIAVFAAVARSESPFKTREDSGTSARDKLLDTLFATYKKENYPENTTVNFGISILNVDFDTDHDVMNTNIWLRYMWTDSRFSWDPDTVGIKVMRIPADKVWLPDTTLYNGMQQELECVKTNALVYSDGRVLWVPPCQAHSYCNLTLTEHPYDQQDCMLNFGSWTFDGFTMGLEFFGKVEKADIDYFGSRKYKVTKNEAVREEKKYDCCEEPYFNLKFNLGFTRQPVGTCERV